MLVCVNFSLHKECKNSWKLKFRVSKCVKMADFALLDSSILISRKIWVMEKSCNFHTLCSIWSWLEVALMMSTGCTIWKNYKSWKSCRLSKHIFRCSFLLLWFSNGTPCTKFYYIPVRNMYPFFGRNCYQMAWRKVTAEKGNLWILDHRRTLLHKRLLRGFYRLYALT